MSTTGVEVVESPRPGRSLSSYLPVRVFPSRHAGSMVQGRSVQGLGTHDRGTPTEVSGGTILFVWQDVCDPRPPRCTICLLSRNINVNVNRQVKRERERLVLGPSFPTTISIRREESDYPSLRPLNYRVSEGPPYA